MTKKKIRTVLHWDKDIRVSFADLSWYVSVTVKLIEEKNYEQGITEDMVIETLRDWMKEERENEK